MCGKQSQSSLTGYVNTIEEMKVDSVKYDNSRILLISDLHAPYHHPKALEFLQGLKDKYKPIVSSHSSLANTTSNSST